MHSSPSSSSIAYPIVATEEPPWLAPFVARLGADKVSTASQDLHAYRRDMWARELLAVAAAQPAGVLPAAVVWPSSTDELQAVVELALAHHVSLTPFGAGSGVTGGATPSAGSLVVDCKRLRSFSLDRDRMTVRCGAGWNGWHIEQAVNRHGLSIGHFPSSIMCSTVGGWVVTRGAGQMSTKYGKIEDMVAALQLVTGRGEKLELDCRQAGPDWVQLVVGSEGRLGFVSEVELQLVPMPQKRLLRGYWFPDVRSGCAAIQQVLQLGLRPSVVRLYDEIDTLIAGTGQHKSSLNQPLFANLSGTAGRFLGQLSGLLGKFELGRSGRPLDLNDLLELLRPDAERARHRLERWVLQTALQKTEPIGTLLDSVLARLSVGCLLIMGCEGEPATATMEEQLVRDEVIRLGGRDLGPEPGEHWLRHRYDVSFKWPRVFAAGAMADTMEFAATWDRLPSLYQKVRAAILPHALIMAHFSHAYPDGCSIYFTFMTRASARGSGPQYAQARVLDDQRRYDEIWQAGIAAALSAGATIGHHHGVGRLRAPFLVDEQGEGLAGLVALGKTLDPSGLCNEGRLFPRDVQLSPKPVVLAAPRAVSVNAQSLLVTAPADLSLRELEQKLRQKELTLGGLAPWAYARTLGDALRSPLPSEACLSSGRLHDRRVQLLLARRDGAGGSLLAIPPQPAPRRSTGPDLGQLFVDGLCPNTCQIVGATLRVERFLAARPALTCGFDDWNDALSVLWMARRWHGGTGLHSIQLFSRALIDSVLPQADLPPGKLLLLVEGGGPLSLASESLRELSHRLGMKAGARRGQVLRDLWSPQLDGAGSPFLALGPLHEQHVSPQELAALGPLLLQPNSRWLVAGVHRHGVALASPDALPVSAPRSFPLLEQVAAALDEAYPPLSRPRGAQE